MCRHALLALTLVTGLVRALWLAVPDLRADVPAGDSALRVVPIDDSVDGRHAVRQGSGGEHGIGLHESRGACRRKRPAARVSDVGRARPANGQLQPNWGLHVIAVNLTIGNLIDIVGQQARAYLARRPSDRKP